MGIGLAMVRMARAARSSDSMRRRILGVSLDFAGLESFLTSQVVLAGSKVHGRRVRAVDER
jgi:hypothetical protein